MPAFEATDPQLAVKDERFTAAIKFLERLGAREFQMRFDDEQRPIVWVAISGYSIINGKPATRGKINAHQTGCGMDPLTAMFNLMTNSLNFRGLCNHCGRNTMFDESFGEVPMADVYCWYQWDPELKLYRRGCEGDT